MCPLVFTMGLVYNQPAWSPYLSSFEFELDVIGIKVLVNSRGDWMTNDAPSLFTMSVRFPHKIRSNEHVFNPM